LWQKGSERVFELPVNDVPWMRSDKKLLKKDRDTVIAKYNEWAIEQEGRTLLLTTEEEIEKEEEALLRREERWKKNKVYEDLYIDERRFRDREPEIPAAKERKEREMYLELRGMTFWGLVRDIPAYRERNELGNNTVIYPNIY
jgi:hypothetical protein